MCVVDINIIIGVFLRGFFIYKSDKFVILNGLNYWNFVEKLYFKCM